MELKQTIQLRHLLVPELRQSLKILTLPLPEIKSVLEQELLTNPFLEEVQKKSDPSLRFIPPTVHGGNDYDFAQSLITHKMTLQDILLRQLGMFTNSDEELRIGQEIIGNIDENGYLKATLEEISGALKLPLEKVEALLKLIQKFDPPGVAARSVSECLLIQLDLVNEKDPLTVKIIESHLDDVAKKNYTRIAKALKEPLANVEAVIKKILKLNPKPGRDYSAEMTHRIIPDIVIDDKDGDLEVSVNDEDIPALVISKAYKGMLKKMADPKEKAFLAEKLRNALELLRAVAKRHRTLKKVIEIIVEIQEEAIREDFSALKPLNFKDVSERLGMHETTVCRVVMNKYVQTPHGVVALKNFFPSHLHDQDGQSVSSYNIKRMIKELIDREDKKQPLSDQEIVAVIEKEKNLKLARRTVAKYREELKILSTAFRRER